MTTFLEYAKSLIYYYDLIYFIALNQETKATILYTPGN